MVPSHSPEPTAQSLVSFPVPARRATENSPHFQVWVCRIHPPPVPPGTTETIPMIIGRPCPRSAAVPPALDVQKPAGSKSPALPNHDQLHGLRGQIPLCGRRPRLGGERSDRVLRMPVIVRKTVSTLPLCPAPCTHPSLANRWPQFLSKHWNHGISLSRTMILPLLGERAGVRADVQSNRRGSISVQKHNIPVRCRLCHRTP